MTCLDDFMAVFKKKATELLGQTDRLPEAQRQDIAV